MRNGKYNQKNDAGTLQDGVCMFDQGVSRVRKRKMRIGKITAAILTLCLMLGGVSTAAFAAQDNRSATTVKVAFYPLDGFFEYDENGKETGYGVDYLNELSKYANIKWEYVPADSWEAIHDMLLRGEVDVQMPVSATINPADTDCSITTEPIIPTFHAIMTLQSRSDLYYQDYDAFRNLKIAITPDTLAKTGFTDYLNSINVMDGLVFYEDYNSCRKALDDGAVDALISNVMDMTADMKMLDKFIVADCYIATRSDAPCYRVINNALTELTLAYPTVQTQLYEKYYHDRTITPFTKEESEYIADTPYLTVAVQPDRKPVSYYDEASGTFQGIAIDVAEEISKNLGIRFEYVPITTTNAQDMLGQADLAMPVTAMNVSKDLFVTQGIIDSEILIAVRNGDSLPKGGAKVGVLSSTPGIQTALKNEDYYELVEYGSNEQAFRALLNGDIDGFANSAHVINWQLGNPRYGDLSALRYQKVPLEYQICGKASDTVLQSALSKAIIAVPESVEDQILARDTAFSFNDLSTQDKLFAYRWEIITVIAAFLLLTIAALLYNRTRSRYIAEIEKKSAAQERANRAKSDFLARMSHDLRTPMNGILGLTDLMLGETNDPKLTQDLSQLEMTGKYLLQLINDTLDVSKIEAGKMELHLQPIDSEAVFGTILANASLLARTKGVVFRVHTPAIEHGKWVPVMADAARLQQIMMNLLSNAVKFTPQGGRVEVTMETVSITEELVTDRYTITDTGIGISEEFMPHIFETFSQESRSEAENERGSGLGMPIVKQLVDMMNGEISIRSKLGEGTSVTLLLRYPVAHEKIQRVEAPVADDAILEGKRVLLCEDHPLNAQIATRLLKKKGIVIERAENGQVGTEMFASSEAGYYDAILMDIRMPVMGGLEAAKIIRAMDRADARTVPIIAMTANAYDEDVRKSIACGMDAHLAKPIDPAILYATLSGFLSGRQQPSGNGI